jgi:hypothetical protein
MTERPAVTDDGYPFDAVPVLTLTDEQLIVTERAYHGVRLSFIPEKCHKWLRKLRRGMRMAQ